MVTFGILAVLIIAVAFLRGVLMMRRIGDMSDAPPQTPPELPRIPLTPIRLTAISERSRQIRKAVTAVREHTVSELGIPAELTYKAVLFDGKKFHQHDGVGQRPFRIHTPDGRSWDQQDVSVDGVMIYVSKDVPLKQRDSAAT